MTKIYQLKLKTLSSNRSILWPECATSFDQKCNIKILTRSEELVCLTGSAITFLTGSEGQALFDPKWWTILWPEVKNYYLAVIAITTFDRKWRTTFDRKWTFFDRKWGTSFVWPEVKNYSLTRSEELLFGHNCNNYFWQEVKNYLWPGVKNYFWPEVKNYSLTGSEITSFDRKWNKKFAAFFSFFVGLWLSLTTVLVALVCVSLVTSLVAMKIVAAWMLPLL